jgi:ribonuclease HII
MILGIDEVGRGCWAGPLVVGAVVLGATSIPGLDDSKNLSKARREQLAPQIWEHASGVGLGWVSAAEIDEIGLSAALKLATKRAVQAMKVPYHEIIIDGTVNFLQGTPLESYVRTTPKADALFPSVSAASIVAKVARDAYMQEQDALYPEYGFRAHVGYGVAKHRAAIAQHGVTPLHRLSIAPLQRYRQPVDLTEQDIAHKQPKAALTTRAIGNSSETAAANYLIRHGHEIIERNWKTKYCEIDIISRKAATLYFTEVKHRKNADAGDGLAAITQKKQNQMVFAAKLYAHMHPDMKDMNLQLAVIATTGELPEVIQWLDLL